MLQLEVNRILQFGNDVQLEDLGNKKLAQLESEHQDQITQLEEQSNSKLASVEAASKSQLAIVDAQKLAELAALANDHQAVLAEVSLVVNAWTSVACPSWLHVRGFWSWDSSWQQLSITSS